ncbi:hypothetical protein AB0A95_19455 [Micromonospora sp. NPDC049230]|uniref:hypothetical protein n=1 Tax=Micromonospora sp. NPDC049230 TaxID=3155502 RepID=UPI003400834E
MGRRPPRTSYGYLAPSGARVLGWECNNDGCGTGDRPAPPSWPHPCRECGRPTDASFDEPWAHEARGYKIQHHLHSTDRDVREMARLERHVWAYKEACFRDDAPAADRAWRAYRRARSPLWQEAEGDEPAVALSRAQQWLRTATRADLTALLPDVEPSGAPGGHPYTDPEYWAAFAYTGA